MKNRERAKAAPMPNLGSQGPTVWPPISNEQTNKQTFTYNSIDKNRFMVRTVQLFSKCMTDYIAGLAM